MISPAAKFALELWHELHPDAAYVPDPRQQTIDFPRDAEPDRNEAGTDDQPRN